MKQNILRTLSVVVALAFSVLYIPQAYAAGVAFLVGLEAVNSSATANGSSTVTLKASAFDYSCYPIATCNGGGPATKLPIANQKVYISVSGSNNTLGGTQSNAEGTYVTMGSDGTAQFTIASTTAETKTVTATDPGKSNSATASVTFKAPDPTPAPTTPKKTTTATPTPIVTPPEAPKPTEMEIDGETVTDTTKITVPENKPFTLKGTTVPGGIVKLYIFSTPREATVTADDQGAWVYSVNDLEPGSHHVEAEVTDPKTQKTSERTTLAAFTVAATPKVVKKVAAAVQPKSNTNNLPWILAGVLVAVAAVGAGAWLLWKHKSKKHTQAMISPELMQDRDNGITPINPEQPNSTTSETDQSPSGHPEHKD